MELIFNINPWRINFKKLFNFEYDTNHWNLAKIKNIKLFYQKHTINNQYTYRYFNNGSLNSAYKLSIIFDIIKSFSVNPPKF